MDREKLLLPGPHHRIEGWGGQEDVADGVAMAYYNSEYTVVNQSYYFKNILSILGPLFFCINVRTNVSQILHSAKKLLGFM